MIKFFRRIRQKLVVENRFSKYLIYALGEIVLVVIGILIALQINNWNENNKIEKDINGSLRAMIDELNENETYFKYASNHAQTRKDGIQKILDGKASNDDKRLILNKFGQSVNSKPFNKIFELLKDEKKLQLIKDKALIKNINKFYEYNLLGLDDLADWHKGFVGDNIDPFIIENIPSNDFLVEPEIVDDLLQKVKFRNILSYQEVMYEAYLQEASYALENAQSLRTDIEKYLEVND
ncbi:MAG: hypothetical protein ED556_02005 [Winogradskyella sp.]|uniref:DUF6090 family protein n=1 Tax=Winogradskyella sp. TaxID=1883156 RepID=UPI000F411A70|nr:DUF6090 family protein [Winogradskyella sp.]RNC87986.1 MAG: hypothetical protein ED556_02005 [Winogradskyella sp.]